MRYYMWCPKCDYVYHRDQYVTCPGCGEVEEMYLEKEKEE